MAPLFSELSIAGGDREIEALGGMVLVQRGVDSGEVHYSAIRPFFSDRKLEDNKRAAWILPPFGRYRRSDAEEVFQLLPIVRFARQYPVAQVSTWSLLAIPGIYWAKTGDGRIVRAWFPVGGILERFLSFDRAEFALFPLWARTERFQRVSHHVLWPIFCFTTGGGIAPSWRVWPLVGRDRHEGRYDRWFVLWPIFHWQKNDQLSANPEHTWMIWPLFGRRVQGPSKSWTALWPLFGYSHNEENGFWAWDGPWPLVVFQYPGESGQALRERVWPFYSRFEGDGLSSRWYGWPFVNVRHEVYPGVTKDTVNVFPFWHAWDKNDETLGKSRWRKLFPLTRSYQADHLDESMYAFPALNPFYRLEFIDEHYAWMWELYSSRRIADQVRERSWLGLYRREKDRDEDRRSLSLLWGRRDYTDGGERVRETSLLFGLVRWRSGGENAGLMMPAIPGPGWPLRRVPRSDS